ncbi:hypothetical protein [Actinoplanes regularis]|uniref:Uncharacterized protein n=1 Tax=Actinoplanes regularis TaxID=52697 RepID=A0A239AY35_9ACTN|nr:hypothetical protein [Actinoplanes regularis]GIE87298.1 hypothetical protein Are01nite_37780 [Actinoplanes regularis]SNS00232.1 hypothetical protein SAMN06264365_108185 [Actinoplanes regularis]
MILAAPHRSALRHRDLSRASEFLAFQMLVNGNLVATDYRAGNVTASGKLTYRR